MILQVIQSWERYIDHEPLHGGGGGVGYVCQKVNMASINSYIVITQVCLCQ